MVWVFYRQLEVEGGTKIPDRGPVLLCANHLNALVDAVILQAALPRPLHPLARSGLFCHPVLRLVLAWTQAVPVFRPQDTGSDPSNNLDSFARCFELLARGEVLLIFPEGQSHSDPHLRPLKTGAARIALGTTAEVGEEPTLLPIGLTFTRKGRFRSRVLVQIGDPISLPALPKETSQAAFEVSVRELTSRIEQGLVGITLNTDTMEDLDLLWRLERFFAFRRGRRSRRHSLSHRFRALQRLVAAHRRLRLHAPQRVQGVRQKLRRFDRLRRACGVRDYHLRVRYTVPIVAWFLGRCLFVLLVVLPLGAWGLVNSSLPFLLTRHLSRRWARGVDQYDTAKILLGICLFLGFWGGQTGLVFWRFGILAATIYGASLPVTAGTALVLRRQKELLLENLKVFILFSRRRQLQGYLFERRQEVERELARLARLVKRLPKLGRLKGESDWSQVPPA